MTQAPPEQVTSLLPAWANGDQAAFRPGSGSSERQAVVKVGDGDGRQIRATGSIRRVNRALLGLTAWG